MFPTDKQSEHRNNSVDNVVYDQGMMPTGGNTTGSKNLNRFHINCESYEDSALHTFQVRTS